MNYLGHSFLSFNRPELLVGNMIGDYVKGMAQVDTYPPGIQQGIWLHRQIDKFADKHPANALAKNLFKVEYQLYAGAIVDVIWDYFLANDPRFFQNEAALKSFSEDTYAHLEKYTDFMPEKFLAVFPSMKTLNWLYNYRTVKGIEKALQGLAFKAKYMEPSDKAYQIFIKHYYELNQRYFEFIDDAVDFVKNKIN